MRAGRGARRKQAEFLCGPLPCQGLEGHSKVIWDSAGGEGDGELGL